MKTSQEWLSKFRGGDWIYALVDVQGIAEIQADAIAHVMTSVENHQTRLYRVDSCEAQAFRALLCELRNFTVGSVGESHSPTVLTPDQPPEAKFRK